jgi:hypothetical protein
VALMVCDSNDDYFVDYHMVRAGASRAGELAQQLLHSATPDRSMADLDL